MLVTRNPVVAATAGLRKGILSCRKADGIPIHFIMGLHDMQLKVIRTLLGSEAPECPKMDISINTWNEIITLAVGTNSGLTSKFNPYYDDVSFMTGAQSMTDFQLDSALHLNLRIPCMNTPAGTGS